MKPFILMVAIAVTSLMAGVAEVANYAGTWTLDMKQSQNLPKFYEGVKSQKLIIRQNERYLDIAVEVDRGQSAPDKMHFLYNLDGTESKTETAIRTPDGMVNLPTTLKAIVGAAGKLQLVIDRAIPSAEKTLKGTTTEDWELSADGHTLTIHRTDETPQGKMQMVMVFVKS